MEKLKEFCGYSVELKCPLPNRDLETLIAVKSDEDSMNIIEEYGRISSPPRPLKIRAILAPPKSPKQISPSIPLRSSSISSFKIKPQRPLKKLPLIQDQVLTAIEESVHHSSSVHPKDQAPTALWINNIKSTHYKDRIRG
ncbi:unnamed protein product [Malus baccata var. baccata]